MKQTRGKIEAALKAKIGLAAVREQSSVADLWPRYAVHPNQIDGWQKQPQEQAARGFDAGVGRDAEQFRQRAIEQRHAKIGQLMVERDFFARRSGRGAPRSAGRWLIATIASRRSAGNAGGSALPALGFIGRRRPRATVPAQAGIWP